ncbi:conserved hypothetical protein [Novosphingobium sp. KN65.2]|nr:conserved hypothetical protein [Novosphingobium sp. KN65.2]
MRIDPASDRSMLDTLRARASGSARRGPWLKLLSDVLTLAGPQAELLRHGERPWSSATFSGSRHSIALSFTGERAVDAGEALIASLPDHEFAIPGHLVADATITGVDHENGPEPRMTVEAELLLLEEG